MAAVSAMLCQLMCNAERSNVICDFMILNICLQKNNKPLVIEQKSSKKTSLSAIEEEKNSYFLVSSVVTSNDNSSNLEKPEVDVMPLCVKCRAQEMVNFAGAKILSDKFILGIDEYSLKFSLLLLQCTMLFIGWTISERISNLFH